MSNFNAWYKQGDNYTHFCAGVSDNEEAMKHGNIKHKETMTEISYWFFPVEADDTGNLKCTACKLQVVAGSIDPIIIPTE